MAIVKAEVPDLRRHVRNELPIGVCVRGIPCTVKNWSLGGFRLDDSSVDGLCLGDRLFAQFTLPYQGLDVSFTTEVEIVRLANEGKAEAARFVSLNTREKEVLSYAMLGGSRNGQRASLIEALARIDIPVSPTQAVPTPREAPPVNTLVQTCRRAIYSLLYWCLGIMLGLTIATILYWYFCRLDLEYSIVSLPLYPVISQDVARTEEMHVKEGDSVHSGQALFRVADDVLSRDVELAEIQHATAKVDLQTAQGRVQKEKELLTLYPEVIAAKLEQARGQVSALTKQVQVGKVMLARAVDLASRKSSSAEAVNALELALAGFEKELALQNGEVRIAEQALNALEKGSYYNSRQLVGDLPQYLVNLEDARERFKVADERVKLARDRARRLTYSAPFDGKVVKLLKGVGGTMNRGETIAILEKVGEMPVIDCFVTQDDVNALSLETKASIWVPALSRTFQGQVVKIDRTSGFLTEMQAHVKESQLRYNWRGQQDRSAYVQIAFTEELSAKAWKELAGGMPAIVSVAKTPTLWQRFQSLWQ
jgi:multidrug efflux pump subunit AcrA (membrane-fusion protein)